MSGGCCTFAGGGFGGSSALPRAVPQLQVLPEQWAENNIRRNQVNHPVDCQLSTSFDTFRMLSAGSITGLSTRLTQTMTAGSLLVEVTKNGAGTGFSLLHTNAANQTGGVVFQAAGIVPYVVGDLIGVQMTTNNLLAPLSNDLETMLQVTEAV